MTCTFFGHKDAPNDSEKRLKKIIDDLIENEGVKNFYVGNNGHFDFLAQRVLAEIKSDIDYAIVLSSINECALADHQDKTIFPEGFENVFPRFAICKRNDWLIKNSDFAIVYMEHKFSNCAKWVEKARKRGLKVINLADESG